MRGLRVVLCALLCALATACGDNPPPSQDAGSPEVIRELANQERSVGDFDVCEAIRDAGAEDDLEKILDAQSVTLEGAFSDSEDALTQSCSITTDSPGGDTELSVLFMQGTEFRRAGTHDPLVFAGCRVAQEAPPADKAWAAAVRATCGPALTVDVKADLRKDAGIRPWTEGPNSKPADEYVDLLHDVLVAVSSRG